MNQTEAVILKTVGEILECPVSLTTLRTDVPEWTSLKMLQIVMALDELGINLPLEKIADIRGVSDMVAMASEESR